MLRFEKKVTNNKIILNKKERERIGDSEIILLLFSSKAVLMDSQTWKRNLQKYLGEQEGRKEKRKAHRAFCSKSHQVVPNKKGVISLPQKVH